jgi:hypothetical protein
MKLPPCLLTLEQLRGLVRGKIGTYCLYCRQVVTERSFSLDHRTPLERGGSSTDVANLDIICVSSNRAKGTFTHDEFRALIRMLDLLDTAYPAANIKGSVLTALKVANSFRFGANRRSKKVGR